MASGAQSGSNRISDIFNEQMKWLHRADELQRVSRAAKTAGIFVVGGILLLTAFVVAGVVASPVGAAAGVTAAWAGGIGAAGALVAGATARFFRSGLRRLDDEQAQLSAQYDEYMTSKFGAGIKKLSSSWGAAVNNKPSPVLLPGPSSAGPAASPAARGPLPGT